jgi:hypothetical protein
VFIHNTEPRLIELAAVRSVRDDGGKTIDELVTVRLMPGMNDADPAKWSLVRASPVAKALVATGKVKPLEEPAAKAGSIRDMNVGEAVKLVGETVDTALLDKWTVEESRKTVLEAIERQLEKLQPSKKA